MEVLDIGGVAAGLRERGEGTPLLLLHGVPSSGLLFRDVMQPLAQAGYRVIAPDLPGYGASGRLASPDIESYLDWLEALLDHLGLDEVALAGQDFGGLLGSRLAVRGRVSRLVLSSAPLGPGWVGATLTALPGLQWGFYQLYAGRLYLRQGAAGLRGETLLSLHLGRIESEPDFGDFMRATALAFPLAGLWRWPGEFMETGVPLGLIWGEQDKVFPLWMARRLAAATGAALTALPGRHALPFDLPDQYAQALLVHLGAADLP